MKLLRNSVLSVLVVLMVAILIGLFLPRTIRIERVTTIEAPVHTVFLIVNTLKATPHWSPWLELDPDTELTFEGPAAGVGNKMLWQSENSSVGSGSQEIVESDPDRRVRTALDFGAMGTPEAEVVLEPEGEGARVTWLFETELGFNPLLRYMGLMIPNFVGPDYERGLANLKAFAESLPDADLAALDVREVILTPRPIVRLRTSADNSPGDLGKALGYAYLSLAMALEAKGVESDGAPLSFSVGSEGGKAVFDAALGVPAGTTADGLPDGSELAMSPAGKALRAAHLGPYKTLPDTYEALLAYAMAAGYDVSGDSWNEYVGDPATSDLADLTTYVYLPVE